MIPKQAILLCGGRGERLRPLTDSIPKPLVPVCGRPFLSYLVEQLRKNGVEKILLLAGYRGEQIAQHFQFIDDVICIAQPEEWETGRRLKDAATLLDPQFMLLYGDTYANVDFTALAEQHYRHRRGLTVSVYRQKGNVRVIGDFIDRYDSDNKQMHNDIGYMIAERDRLLPKVTSGSFSLALADMAWVGGVAAHVHTGDYLAFDDAEGLRRMEEYFQLRVGT